MIFKEVKELQEENETATRGMDIFADAGDSGMDESYFEQMAAAYNKDGVLGVFGFFIANGVIDLASSVILFKNYNAGKYDAAGSVEELMRMVESDAKGINDKIRKSAQEYKVKRKRGIQ